MRELKENYFQYGTAVPSEALEYFPREYEKHVRRKEEERRKLNAKNARRRAHKRSLRAAKLKLISVTFSIGLIGSMLFTSVYLQNKVSESKNNITKLEDEIAEVIMINDATKSRIDTAVNLNYIKERAVLEMGMVYAGSDHVIYYELDDSDYMIKQ